MTRLATTLLAIAAPLVLTLTLVAQPATNQGLAGKLVSARQKNLQLMMTYNWNSRTEVQQNGHMEDQRIDLVSLMPDGMPRRELLNDQHTRIPIGFLRHAIKEGQLKGDEQLVKDVSRLLDQYTLPTTGAVSSFIANSNVQTTTSPDGASVLQVQGTGIVLPGDSLTVNFNASTLLPDNAQISTNYNGDPVTVQVTYRTLGSGLNHVQFATAQIPSKGITVNLHNYDYVQNN